MFEKFVQLTCNGCGDIDEQLSDGTVTEARKSMRKYGWRHSGCRDYCRSCVELGKMKGNHELLEEGR